MANPIADSEAAIVKINKENNCPYKSSKYNEKYMKFKFKDNNINSIPIKTIKIFRKLKKIPNKQIKKIIKLTPIKIISKL